MGNTDKLLKDILISGAILLGTSLIYFNSDYRKKLFNNPTNIAQKVANYCVLESDKKRNAFFNGGESKGFSYDKKFIIDRTAYHVEVTSWNNRPNEMRIQSNFFNRDLPKDKLSETDVMDMLLYGTPKLFSANFYFDKNLDGILDEGNIFTKPVACGTDSKDFSCGGVFKIEELRENLSDEKNTLKYESFDLRDFKKNKKEFQEDFKTTLEKIADHFDINK